MVVSRALARYDLRTVFALAGAGHTHLLDALDRDGFRIVSGRHESGTIGAADGYARITGRPGVALTIADQGMPNAVNGIATAFHAASPVVVLVARLPDSWTEAEAESDNLQHRLVGSIVKWARTVPSAERLAEYVDVACRRALTGRPGPVLLQIPQEFLGATLPEDALPARTVPPMARAAADPSRIAVAARLLARAERPLLIAGAGAARGGAGEALSQIVQEYAIPIAGNGLGRGVVPEDWEHSFAWPLMQSAAKDADVVCLVGARLKQRLGYGLPPRFSASARFIQVDVEAEELSRNRRIDVPIVADAGLATSQLAKSLAREKRVDVSRRGWVASVLKERFAYLDAIERDARDPIHPLALGRAIARAMPRDAILVGDGADVQNWMYGALRVTRAPGFLDHYPLGAMGVGTPLAVGAAAAAREIAERTDAPERTVVLTTGDGSFGFHPAELHAAARAGLKLVCVIGNDGAWGTELHGQAGAIGRAVNTELGYLHYELIGLAFGCHAEHVERQADLEPALARAFDAKGPAVVNVQIDRAAGAAIKREPLARMILFDDLASQLKSQRLSSGPG
jgi:acetolactate synthase-1/2/3 large subunit